MLRNFGIFLFFIALLGLGYVVELGQYGVEPGLEITVTILLWLAVLGYQNTSFYRHRLNELPKEHIFCVLEKDRKGADFIFILAELESDGSFVKKRKLVHTENIMEPYFRVSPNGELETVSMKQ